MPVCQGCKKSFGCGCSLKNGLCDNCRPKPEKKIEIKKK